MKCSYFLINSFKPVECFDIDNIDFVKRYFNTSDVIRLSYNQYKKINNHYENYIFNLISCLNNKM